MKNGVLKNLAKFIGKHLCQSLFFNKVADVRPVTLLKKRLWHRFFPGNFAKSLRTPFLQNISGRLLLIPPHRRRPNLQNPIVLNSIYCYHHLQNQFQNILFYHLNFNKLKKVLTSFFSAFSLFTYIFETLCVIWQYWYNLKNVKFTHGEMLLLVKLQSEPFTFSN